MRWLSLSKPPLTNSTAKSVVFKKVVEFIETTFVLHFLLSSLPQFFIQISDIAIRESRGVWCLI